MLNEIEEYKAYTGSWIFYNSKARIIFILFDFQFYRIILIYSLKGLP